MSKTKFSILIVMLVVFSIAMQLFFCVCLLFLIHYHGRNIVFEWNETDLFDISTIQTINKDPNKDFVILNLADIQMQDLEDLNTKQIVHSEIAYLIEQTKPDLITLTGDQTWSNENLLSLLLLVSWLDSFKIPYAPVFGNHDYGNQKNSSVADLNFCCDIYERGKYSLFKRGPSNLGGLGNYVINIVEGNKIVKTLFMLDSGYEEKISNQQIAWFSWNCEGIKQANGGNYSSSMCFFHKPLPEYRTAYNHYITHQSDVEAIGDVHVHYSLNGSTQNGFFDVAKQKNVKDIVCGHQHGNNFTLKFQDVRLSFALKTDELGGFYDDGITNLNGGTVFKLNSSMMQIQNFMVPSGMFHINGSDNCFND